MLGGQALAVAETPRQFLEKRVMLALEPAGRPVAHEHQQVFPSTPAGTVQAFVKMFVAWIQIMRLGRETFGKIIRQTRFEKPFHFLHHAFGDPFRREQRVAFQLRGE